MKKHQDRNFSVIIPTRNRCAFLFGAALSTLVGLPSDGETIVVDDGSTPPGPTLFWKRGTSGLLSKAGKTMRCIFRLESCRHSPSLATLKGLSDGLNIRMSALIEAVEAELETDQSGH